MKKYLHILGFLALISCNNKSSNSSNLEDGYWVVKNSGKIYKEGEYINGFKTGNWNYTLNEESQSITWKIYDENNIKVNYPSNWQLNEPRENSLFFANIDNKHNIFLINKIDKGKLNSTLSKYLLEIIQNFNSNKEEVSNYECTKLEFTSRYVYFLRVETMMNNFKKHYYMLLTEDGNFIYDHTLVLDDKAKTRFSTEIFGSVSYSLSINGEKLFYKDDFIKSRESIEIEDFKN